MYEGQLQIDIRADYNKMALCFYLATCVAGRIRPIVLLDDFSVSTYVYW